MFQEEILRALAAVGIVLLLLMCLSGLLDSSPIRQGLFDKEIEQGLSEEEIEKLIRGE